MTLTTEGHTLIMGVVNATPDSFSDGSGDINPQGAISHGLALWEQGADIVDVGGESTRPGAAPVDAAAEIDRVVPVVDRLAAEGVVVSIDTMKPAVAAAALAAGAEIVNDVSGFRDPAMLEVAAGLDAAIVIMHMRGMPRTMQDNMEYGDVVAEISAYLQAQTTVAQKAGVSRKRICIDPGIGFGKSHLQHMDILDRLPEIISENFPVMIGASRKGFLGSILQAAGLETVAAQRDSATAATVAASIIGGAAVVRVHDVAGTLQVARTTDAIVRGHFESRKTIGRT